MNDWIIIGAVMAGTMAVSVGFWLVLMPRLASPTVGKGARIASIALFGAVLFAIPVIGFVLLAENTVPLICALFVGWGMAVRVTAWFAARKFFVPRLKAMQRADADDDASPPNPDP